MQHFISSPFYFPSSLKQLILGFRQPILFLFCLSLFTYTNQTVLADNTLSTNSNPHWNSNYCQTCHASTPTKAKLSLIHTNVSTLCITCHQQNITEKHIHPIGMKPGSNMLSRMSVAFRDSLDAQGQLACATCHDIPMQCLSSRKNEQELNSKFLRGGPYYARSGICFSCHDESKYQRLNPHDQIDENGTINRASCTLCHRDEPNLGEKSTIDKLYFSIENDLSTLCTRCHPWKPHPGASFSFNKKRQANHLRVPPSAMLQRMQVQQNKMGIILPLDPTNGKIFCGTCHNPHEKGILKHAADKGADSKYRLRHTKICINCHDK